MQIVLKLGIALAALAMSVSASAITIHTTDFIGAADRTRFNGFEGMAGGAIWSGRYTEDGITVTQVNESSNGIWTACTVCGREGERSWYPNMGDWGYTQIRKADGSDFDSVGFLIGSGFFGNSGAAQILYELFDDETSVLSGLLIPTFVAMDPHAQLDYLGFSGGGFDTIWLRDTLATGFFSFGDNYQNALNLDSIELAEARPIPEPTTVALLGAGLVAFWFARRRRLS
jgi:hypothetical protein